MDTCERCGRPVSKYGTHFHPEDISYAYVVHDFYGCDTGCCGHRVYFCDKEDRTLSSHFTFSHPYGDPKEVFWKDCLQDTEFPEAPLRLDLCEVVDD